MQRLVAKKFPGAAFGQIQRDLYRFAGTQIYASDDVPGRILDGQVMGCCNGIRHLEQQMVSMMCSNHHRD